MTQTTLIGGLGLAVFAFSTFTPTQCFGVMMLALLTAALIGDLVFLPALLAGPLGKYFCPPVTAFQESAADTPRGSVGTEGTGTGETTFAAPHISGKPGASRHDVTHRRDRGHKRFNG